MSFDNFGTPNHDNPSDINMRHEARAGNFQSPPSSLTQTVTISVRNKFSKLKTLVLKLKPNGHQPDLSSMNSKQIDTFVDEMIGDLRQTFTNNINDLRERIKSARPNQSDPNYSVKMELYQELLTNMVPVIQKIQTLAGQILDELNALINQLWDDICKNNGQEVDRLLEEHARRTEVNISRTFLEPLDLLEAKLNKIKPMNSH